MHMGLGFVAANGMFIYFKHEAAAPEHAICLKALIGQR
jgi:hypothetical protein